MNIHIVLKNFRTINTFGRDIYGGTITLKEADKDQIILLVKNKIKPQNPEKKRKRKNTFLKTYMHFLMVEKEFLMFLKAEYFQ